MCFDDYMFVVIMFKDGFVEGELYVDDGDFFDYEKGQYIYCKFSFNGSIFFFVDVEGCDGKSF